MKTGDVIESAIWLSGDESAEDRRRFEADVTHALTELCDHFGFLHGPVMFVEKRPGDDRVPPVPDHIQGQRVRLLVAEAEVVSRKPEQTPDSFVANLEPDDLRRLREITQRAYMRQFRGRRLTDGQLDEVIEGIGPDAALDCLRRSRMH